jgi:Sel1 repeat
MNHRFTLDVPSLQKVLEAAWVLQCERDRELSEADDEVTLLAVPSDDGEWTAAVPLTSLGNVYEPARAVAEAHTSQICESPDPSVVPTPLTVSPTFQRAEVAGALALAPELDCLRPRDPVPFSGPDVKKPAQGENETAVAHIIPRASLTLVPLRGRDIGRNKHKSDEEHFLSTRTASVVRHAAQLAAAYAVPMVVLLVMLAFLFSQLGIHRPALAAMKAAPPVPKVARDKVAVDKIFVAESPTHGQVGQAQTPLATRSDILRTDSPALESAVSAPVVPEPSHLRVTDPAASSLVADLSPYEVQTVRQQAQYGDDAAALTLGMAYEIGHHVPRSCTEAAHWVAIAAEEGNSAAQYNLALRYLSGDGTPTNLDEARKWLEKAAGHGYQKARITLQAPGL